jgi:hypothetical protein
VVVQRFWRGRRARARVVRGVRREFEQAVAAIEGGAGCEWRRATLCRPAWPPRAGRARAQDAQDSEEPDERERYEREQFEQRAQALELRRSHLARELGRAEEALQRRILALSQGA